GRKFLARTLQKFAILIPILQLHEKLRIAISKDANIAIMRNKVPTCTSQEASEN
ncbi:unnamed protein product, partial [Musa textilis]